MTNAKGRRTGASGTTTTGRRAWREVVAPYCAADPARSAWQLGSSALGLVGCEVAALWLLGPAPALAVVLQVCAAGFLVRLFILQHDCGHGSFSARARTCNVVGTLLGFVTMTPYHAWRRSHAIHHATSGDLDRRGVGDIKTLTVREYLALPRAARVRYRAYRNPLVMFLVGPLFMFLIAQRSTGMFGGADAGPEVKRSVVLTNVFGTSIFVAIVLFGGWRALLLVHLPVSVLAGIVGVFLFYVQHQFENAYWRRRADWEYADAALRGATYLRLPRVLRYFTGDIGFHHIHHLAPRIPNHRLARCMAENAPLFDGAEIGLWTALRSIGLKLYDEDARRMIGWRELRATRARSLDRPPIGAAQPVHA